MEDVRHLVNHEVGEGIFLLEVRWRHVAGCFLTQAQKPRRVLAQQLGEQALLGGQVGRHRPVIVQMVARQIGESSGRNPDTVQAELLKTVTGSLECQVVGAFFRQLCQTAVELHRIGCRERGRCAGPCRYQAQGAQTGSPLVEQGLAAWMIREWIEIEFPD